MPWKRSQDSLIGAGFGVLALLALGVTGAMAQGAQFGSGVPGILDADCPGPGCPLNSENIMAMIERQRDALKKDRSGLGPAATAGVQRGIRIFDSDGQVEVKRRKPIRILAQETEEVPEGLPELDPNLSVTLGIGFDKNSARIRRDSVPLLQALCDGMQAQSHQAFYVVGHTDAGGSAKFNLVLSHQRAESVLTWLEENCSQTLLLEAVGLGEERLLPEHPPQSPLQRRVEIIVRL